MRLAGQAAATNAGRVLEGCVDSTRLLTSAGVHEVRVGGWAELGGYRDGRRFAGTGEAYGRSRAGARLVREAPWTGVKRVETLCVTVSR